MSDERDNIVFDVVQPIDQGGQADIFLLRHRNSGSVFAGKFLREAWDPFARLQFRREAERQARLAGPNVVRIISWNFDAERPFIVLEYMPNGSLAREIAKRKCFGLLEALQIVRQIAVAVAELHSRRVVHRDLKPGNILRAENGRLLLNDFGIAATMTFEEFVRTPTFVGTPAYAAPEQLRGIATEKSDIFAIGVILRECLTGTPVALARVANTFGPTANCVDQLIGRLTNPDPNFRPAAFETIRLIDSTVQDVVQMMRLATPRASAAVPILVGSAVALAAIVMLSGKSSRR